MNFTSAILTTKDLLELKKSSKLIILNSTLIKIKSIYVHQEYQLKGARNFDLKNTFLDLESDLVNTIPSKEKFEKEARNLGINKDSIIVIYDEYGVYSSPRAWFLFKLMGHKEVYILNGGFPECLTKKLALELKYSKKYKSGNFEVNYKDNWLRSLSFIKGNYNNYSNLIIDARSSDRFSGKEKEPREGMRSGAIPHSKNLPYTEIIEGNFLLSKDLLKAKFESLEINSEELIFTCGSGITACILALSAFELGYKKISIYDGSWSEWGSLKDTVII